jgi:hypothetical protein
LVYREPPIQLLSFVNEVATRDGTGNGYDNGNERPGMPAEIG